MQENPAEAATMVRDGDMQIKIYVHTKVYLKIMGDAYLAWKYGEIDKTDSKELLALAVYTDVYLGLRIKS